MHSPWMQISHSWNYASIRQQASETSEETCNRLTFFIWIGSRTKQGVRQSRRAVLDFAMQKVASIQPIRWMIDLHPSSGDAPPQWSAFYWVGSVWATSDEIERCDNGARNPYPFGSPCQMAQNMLHMADLTTYDTTSYPISSYLSEARQGFWFHVSI